MGGCFSSKRQGNDAPEGTAEANSSSASATANGAGAEATNERVNENETSVGSASGASLLVPLLSLHCGPVPWA
jgi:hypothetical protein